MTKKVQIIIDGNAVGHAAHNMDPLTNTSGDQVQAVIGFLGTIAAMKKEFPDGNMIVLWDGRSWRHDALPTYKETREADLSVFDPSKPMSEVEQKKYQTALKKAHHRAAYKKQGPWLKEAISYLAIPQVTCGNYEADDLAAIFTDTYVKQGYPVRLVTSDGDWMQLVQNRVVWKQSRTPYTFVNTSNFHEKAKVSGLAGFPTAKEFLEAKLLAGDSGDCVPGIGGFGPVTLGAFFTSYGGLDPFYDLTREQVEANYTPDPKAKSKKVPKVIMQLHEIGRGNPAIEFNRTLMDLRTTNRPKPERFVTEKGEIDKKGLLGLSKRLDLYRLASDIDRFVQTFEKE